MLLVSGKMVELYCCCFIAHWLTFVLDMYEVVDSYHEFIVLDAVIVIEIIIGVVDGKLYRSNLPELPVVSKAMWYR